MTDRDRDREAGDESKRFGRLENIVPDVVRKAMVSGLGALFMTEETIRSAFADLRLPKEAISYVVQQVDHTKDRFLELVARELREYFEKVDLAGQLQKMLTNVTFEITTQVKLVPGEGSGIDAHVVGTNLGVRRGKKKKSE